MKCPNCESDIKLNPIPPRMNVRFRAATCLNCCAAITVDTQTDTVVRCHVQYRKEATPEQ